MIFITRTIVALGFLSLFFIIAVPSADAKSVIRTGETVSILEDQSIEGDFYSAASTISVSGIIEEDIVSAGGQIHINGEVGGNAFLVAGRTDVNGTIGDDLRIISGEVIITKPVMGDVFVMGGSVKILSTASVAGDVILYAGDATVEGPVGGDVMGTIDTLRIDALVSGNVDVTVTQLTLGDRANVEGSVQYVSKLAAVQSLSATVAGDLVRNDPVFPVNDVSIGYLLIPAFVLLFSVLVWYLVSKRTLSKVVQRSLLKSPKPVLLGLAFILFAPVAGTLLLISTIGSLVGLVILFSYVLLLVLGIVATAALLGFMLMNLFDKSSNDNTLTSLALGVVGVSLLMLIPVIGQLIILGLILVTVGAMVDMMIRPNLK